MKIEVQCFLNLVVGTRQSSQKSLNESIIMNLLNRYACRTCLPSQFLSYLKLLRIKIHVS